MQEVEDLLLPPRKHVLLGLMRVRGHKSALPTWVMPTRALNAWLGASSDVQTDGHRTHQAFQWSVKDDRAASAFLQQHLGISEKKANTATLRVWHFALSTLHTFAHFGLRDACNISKLRKRMTAAHTRGRLVLCMCHEPLVDSDMRRAAQALAAAGSMPLTQLVKELELLEQDVNIKTSGLGNRRQAWF